MEKMGILSPSTCAQCSTIMVNFMKNYDYWKKSQITDISIFSYWLHQKGVGIYELLFQEYQELF
jgi:hypothetical protein